MKLNFGITLSLLIVLFVMGTSSSKHKKKHAGGKVKAALGTVASRRKLQNSSSSSVIASKKNLDTSYSHLQLPNDTEDLEKIEEGDPKPEKGDKMLSEMKNLEKMEEGDPKPEKGDKMLSEMKNEIGTIIKSYIEAQMIKVGELAIKICNYQCMEPGVMEKVETIRKKEDDDAINGDATGKDDVAPGSVGAVGGAGGGVGVGVGAGGGEGAGGTTSEILKLKEQVNRCTKLCAPSLDNSDLADPETVGGADIIQYVCLNSCIYSKGEDKREDCKTECSLDSEEDKAGCR